MKNKSKKQIYFNPIIIDIDFTTNIEKLLWAEKVWGGPHRKFVLGPMKSIGALQPKKQHHDTQEDANNKEYRKLMRFNYCI
jgi:hypothetical protein